MQPEIIGIPLNSDDVTSITRKAYLSGSIDAADTNLKRIHICFRDTLEIIGTTAVHGGNWVVNIQPDVNPEELVVLGFDEGGTYNLDAYDRASAATKVFEPNEYSYFQGKYEPVFKKSFHGTIWDTGTYPDAVNNVSVGTRITDLSDTFAGTDGEAPDNTRWYTELGKGESIEIVSNKIRMAQAGPTVSGVELSGKIHSWASFTGTFDIEVGYDLVDASASDSILLEFVIMDLAEYNKVSVGIKTTNGVPHFRTYAKQDGGTGVESNFDDLVGTSGKVRIVRGIDPVTIPELSSLVDNTGGTDIYSENSISLLYKDDTAEWVLIKNAFAVPSTEFIVGFEQYNRNSEPGSIALSNFVVHSATAFHEKSVFADDFNGIDGDLPDQQYWKVCGQRQTIQNDNLLSSVFFDKASYLQFLPLVKGDFKCRFAFYLPYYLNQSDAHCFTSMFGFSKSYDLYAECNTTNVYDWKRSRLIKTHDINSFNKSVKVTSNGECYLIEVSRSNGSFQLNFWDSHEEKWVSRSVDFENVFYPNIDLLYLLFRFWNSDALNSISSSMLQGKMYNVSLGADAILLRPVTSPVSDNCTGTEGDFPNFDCWAQRSVSGIIPSQGWRYNANNQYELILPAGSAFSLDTSYRVGGNFVCEVEFEQAQPSSAFSKFSLVLSPSEIFNSRTSADQTLRITSQKDVATNTLFLLNRNPVTNQWQVNNPDMPHYGDGNTGTNYQPKVISRGGYNSSFFVYSATYAAIDLGNPVIVNSVIAATIDSTSYYNATLGSATLEGSNDSTNGTDGTWTAVLDMSILQKDTSYTDRWQSLPTPVTTPGSYQWYRISGMSGDGYTRLYSLQLFDGKPVDESTTAYPDVNKLRLSRTASDILFECYDTAWHTLKTISAESFPQEVEAVSLITENSSNDDVIFKINSFSVTADRLTKHIPDTLNTLGYIDKNSVEGATGVLWESPVQVLDKYDGLITESKCYWQIASISEDIPEADRDKIVNVYVSISGGAWELCTNGGSIPGITAGMATAGETIQFKIKKYGYRGIVLQDFNYELYTV